MVEVANQVAEESKVTQDAEKETEVIEDVESKVKYTGKIIYPIKESAAKMREKYLVSKSPLISKISRIVRVPARKPKQVRRTSR